MSNNLCAQSVFASCNNKSVDTLLNVKKTEKVSHKIVRKKIDTISVKLNKTNSNLEMLLKAIEKGDAVNIRQQRKK